MLTSRLYNHIEQKVDKEMGKSVPPKQESSKRPRPQAFLKHKQEKALGED
jgi:hypothetical protein